MTTELTEATKLERALGPAHGCRSPIASNGSTKPADVWWIGFDCGHYLDEVPSSAKMFARRDTKMFARRDRATYRDAEYVKAEIERLVTQALDAGSP